MMKGLFSTLGYAIGVLYILLGVVLLFGGPALTGPLNSMIENSAEGLRTSGEAVSSVTDGVSRSTSMVEEVKVSMENTSEALASIADVINQTVGILEETRLILPAIANDMASMPPMLRNMMPNNHFDEVAERAEIVSQKLGLLNSRLEDLTGDVIVTSNSIANVAVSVENLQETLLSAEGSFSDAASQMESTAVFLEKGSFSAGIVVFTSCAGILLVLTGIYQFISALMISKMSREQVTK